MKPLALKKEETEKSQNSTQLVDINTVRQIAEEAADKATKTSFQKFQEFYEQQNQLGGTEQVKEDESVVFEEDSPDMMNFDKKAFRSVSNTLKTIQAMKQAFETPASPVETAVSQVVEKVSLNLAERLMGGIGSGGQSTPIGRSSFVLDLLNTQAAASFGHAFGENITSVVQALTSSLGAQKTQELVDNVNRKISGESAALPEGNPEVEKQKDMVLQLDSNNPVHVSQYAQAMGLSEKAAKEMLVVHQNDIRTERQGVSGSNINNGSSNGNSEILNVLNIMAQELSGMKQTVVSLQSELDSMKGKKKTKQEDLELEPTVDTDDRWNEEIPRNQSINIEKREVNLFSQPVKVDIDEIAKGSNLKDSFFENPSPVKEVPKEVLKEIPKEAPKESVLEEVKDKDGNSTFKMSGEEPEIEEEREDIPGEAEEYEKETNDEPEEVEVQETPKEHPKEADIKKENEKVEVNETSTQDKKRIRRVIRKITKPSEVTLKQEFYDINNNLIN